MGKKDGIDKRTYGRKLTPNEVADFRAKWQAKLMTPREIQQYLGVSMVTVRRMLTGETYLDVANNPERVAFLERDEAEQNKMFRMPTLRSLYVSGKPEIAAGMNPTQEELEDLAAEGLGPLAAKQEQATPMTKSRGPDLSGMSGTAKARLKAIGFLSDEPEPTLDRGDPGYPD